MSGSFTGFESSDIQMSFYNVSSKATNISGESNTSAFDGQMWSATLFTLPNAEIDDTDRVVLSGMYYQPSLDLVWDTYGIAYGIFSCNTTLSEVTYTTDMNGNILNTNLTPMNDTASAPFSAALGYGYGDLNLNQGLNLAGVSAKSSEDLHIYTLESLIAPFWASPQASLKTEQRY